MLAVSEIIYCMKTVDALSRNTLLSPGRQKGDDTHPRISSIPVLSGRCFTEQRSIRRRTVPGNLMKHLNTGTLNKLSYRVQTLFRSYCLSLGIAGALVATGPSAVAQS